MTRADLPDRVRVRHRLRDAEQRAHDRQAGRRHPGRRRGRASPSGFLASAVRNIARIVDFLPVFYLVGTISIVATEHDQRLGDLAAGTHRRPRSLPRALAHAGADHVSRPDAVATWDVSAIERQRGAGGAALPRPPARAAPRRRARTSRSTSSNRLGPKVAGIPPNSHPEYVLEGIVVAKQGRT